jgi:hypothetical protein
MVRPEGLVRNVFLMTASVMGCLALYTDPVLAQVVPLTNVEIRMVKTSTRPPLRISADTRNPNDFSIRDIEVDCTIKDKTGKTLATYTSVILATLPPNLRMTTRNLNIGAWPQQGYAALCVSKRALRLPGPGAAAPPASAPPPAASAPPAPATAQDPAPTAPAAAK